VAILTRWGCYEYRAMRTLAIVFSAALLGAAAASANTWQPPQAWLAQAMCVHAKEAPWHANTGNGFYGGFQFMRTTWLNLGGAPDPAFTHPGAPFAASKQQQLYMAWRLWKHDGGTWRSWGAVGRACSQ
jgi:resuscitation-promoting factor RpfA